MPSPPAHRFAHSAIASVKPLRNILVSQVADSIRHDEAPSLGIVDEALQAVDEVCVVEGVTADADARRQLEAAKSAESPKVTAHAVRIIGTHTRAEEVLNYVTAESEHVVPSAPVLLVISFVRGYRDPGVAGISFGSFVVIPGTSSPSPGRRTATSIQPSDCAESGRTGKSELPPIVGAAAAVTPPALVHAADAHPPKVAVAHDGDEARAWPTREFRPSPVELRPHVVPADGEGEVARAVEAEVAAADGVPVEPEHRQDVRLRGSATGAAAVARLARAADEHLSPAAAASAAYFIRSRVPLLPLPALTSDPTLATGANGCGGAMGQREARAEAGEAGFVSARAPSGNRGNVAPDGDAKGRKDERIANVNLYNLESRPWPAPRGPSGVETASVAGCVRPRAVRGWPRLVAGPSRSATAIASPISAASSLTAQVGNVSRWGI